MDFPYLAIILIDRHLAKVTQVDEVTSATLIFKDISDPAQVVGRVPKVSFGSSNDNIQAEELSEGLKSLA
jgi:hypothetical protein